MRKSFVSFGLILLSVPAFAQTPAAAPLPPYEVPPVLDARVILRPEFDRGYNFAVQPPVPTSRGLNHFTIDTADSGVNLAEGNTALIQRIAEIQAIAKLREVSRSESYKQALQRAAKSPLALAQNLIEHPVGTVGDLGKGLWNTVNGVGQAVKEAGQGRKQSKYEDSTLEGAIGFSKAKRQIALSLGVDPYSTNPELQKELKSIAWAAYAGQMTLTGALMPVGGAVGLTLRSVNTGSQTYAALRDLSPADLRLRNLKILLAMGIDRAHANAFLNNPALSPMHQTVIVDSLAQLRGAKGRAIYVKLATAAANETEAIRYTRQAQLLAAINRSQPISAVFNYRRAPLAMNQHGALIIPLEWDYAAWTKESAGFLDVVKSGHIAGHQFSSVQLYLTGVASPTLKSVLAANHIALAEKSLPGPLR
ncbi:hypothetical protein TSACC_22002 [Terrimicrobium sacchariphilum]|uniref:Uncharacterized protein n=1 Tax=Terrimicrobium sacchariphilum TaxID=690879 RepID=A0A146G791_TERSA|nr:hypothetical protein [Terrimicrobium sacchariphilum]GAT33585.1 hypothetical protein TSACC_22002 [Terrimicrobium sacchariphilum]